MRFIFETKEEKEKAREALSRHNFFFPDNPSSESELTEIDRDQIDYLLELLLIEGIEEPIVRGEF